MTQNANMLATQAAARGSVIDYPDHCSERGSKATVGTNIRIGCDKDFRICFLPLFTATLGLPA